MGEIEVTLAAPVIVEGRLEALINLESFSAKDAFSEETVQFAEVLAKQVGVVLRRLQLQREAERREAVQELLSKLERLLLAFGSLADFFPMLAELLLEAPIGVDNVALYRLTSVKSARGRPLRFKWREVRQSVRAQMKQKGLLDLSRPRGFAAHAALKGEPSYSPDVREETRPG